jgi:hypothetical protein
MAEPPRGGPGSNPWDRRPPKVPPWPPSVLALREPRRPERTPEQRAAIVSPFMQRLRTPQPGTMSSWWHAWDALELLAGRVLDSWTLRTALCALIGFGIGAWMEATTGPFEIKAGARVLLSVSAPVTGALWGAIFGGSAKLFFRLVLVQAWEWVGILILLGAGLAFAAAALVRRLSHALLQLTF